MTRAALLVTVVGCYAPSVTPGAPCDQRAVCPRDQVCVNGRCQTEGTPAGDDAAVTPDAPEVTVDAPTPDGGLGAWSAPTVAGIGVGMSKTDPSFTADRLTVAFMRNDDLFLATRPAIGSPWVIADLDALNDTTAEKSPELAADGKTIYFASNPDGDFDIFTSTLGPNGWSTPVKVPNWDSGSSEQDIAISPDGLTAFLGISGDLRRSTRATTSDPWPPPVDLGIAWGTNATAPAINSAGDVYYHAGSTRDLWVARRTATGYATPVPVTELNTGGRDAAPFVSADDRHIMFERDSEIYESSR